jgi:hypothetical protein
VALEIQEMLDQYAEWIRDNTELRQINGWVEITTPYLDRHNDHLQIYAKRDDDHFVLTDDGYIIQDLEQSGCSLNSNKRRQLLEITINGFGIRMDNDALMVHASYSNFAYRKHSLVQAMLAVNDLFYLAAPTVASLFIEDVASWLDNNEIRHTPQVKLAGESGYDHVFDFVIPKSRQKPERILKAINQPNKDNAQATAFAWVDTRKVRSSSAQAYVLLNDSERAPASAVVEALNHYELRPVLWSHRDSIKEELAA